MELESELNDCDIILQLLDENFFEDSAELQLDFERAVDEVGYVLLPSLCLTCYRSQLGHYELDYII